MTDQDLRVKQLAYRIWESEGRPSGQEQRHWDMALKIVQAEHGHNTPVDDLPLEPPNDEPDLIDERGASDYAKPEPITSPAQAPVAPGETGKETIADAEKKANARAGVGGKSAAEKPKARTASAKPGAKAPGTKKPAKSPRKPKSSAE